MWSQRHMLPYGRQIWTGRLPLCRICCCKSLFKNFTAIRRPSHLNLTQSIVALRKANSREYSTTGSTQSDRGGTKMDIGELVYTGSINTGVYIAKCISLGSSATGICLQPWILSKMVSSALVFKVAMISVTGVFVFGTPFLLHFLCKRYVTKLHYNKDTRTFTASRLNFFARTKKMSFTPEEIRETSLNPLSNYEIHGQAFFVDTDELRERNEEAYIVFMKYDKPLDLDKYMPKSK